MNLVAPTRVRIQKDVIVRLHRSLKGTGVLNVSQGQEVSPSEIIGTAQVSPGFRTINLADLLKVAPKDVEKYMKRAVGQRIYKGELLAYKEGFLTGKRFVTSPADGVLDFLNPKSGELRMKFLPKKQDLPAGVYGIVELVDNLKGQVIIRTQVTIVHGVFGSGRTRDGILHLSGRKDQIIDKAFISPKYEGQILIGGSLVFKDAITAGISAGLSGIITGGINAKDYRGMAGGRLVFPKKLENDIGLSIIVCEGFGSIPIAEDIYSILTKYDGKYVSVDGNRAVLYLPSFSSSSLSRVKATKLPPLQDGELTTYDEQDADLVELRPGLRVRIIGNSFSGEQGRIINLDRVETAVPSGLKVSMTTVETLRRKIKVPVANLEIML